MGYKTSEKDRKPGYKQIKNIQKSILEKAKKLLNSNSFDISDYGTFWKPTAINFKFVERQ